MNYSAAQQFSKIERFLYVVRIQKHLYLYQLKGVSRNTASSIEQHENYFVRTFFDYVRELDCLLCVNKCLCNDIKEFGEQLNRHRKQQNLSMYYIKNQYGIPFNQIVRIEKGRGYSKKILIRYLDVTQPEISIIKPSKI